MHTVPDLRVGFGYPFYCLVMRIMIDNPAAAQSGFLRHLSRKFIAGLLAILPLALTLAVMVWLVEFLQRFLGRDSAVGKMLQSVGLKFATSEFAAYLIGVLMTLALIYLLGVIVEAGMKNRWSAMVDGVMDRLPLVRSIYNALKKLMQIFDAKDQSELKAMKAVMCHLGGKGGTAVLALLPSADRIHMHGQDYYSVLIPTAPVPFGGAILYVPVEWVEPADIAFDGLLNIYMSMGATSSDYLHPTAGKPVAEAGGDSSPNPEGPQPGR